jgi:hypothetical protein
MTKSKVVPLPFKIEYSAGFEYDACEDISLCFLPERTPRSMPRNYLFKFRHAFARPLCGLPNN